MHQQVKCTAKDLSCCFQSYLNCKSKQENDHMFALMFSNQELKGRDLFRSLRFDELEADPSLLCSTEVDRRGQNNIKSNDYTSLSSLNERVPLKITRNTFANAKQCKNDSCCYAPSHQMFMNLTKQHPLRRSTDSLDTY